MQNGDIENSKVTEGVNNGTGQLRTLWWNHLLRVCFNSSGTNSTKKKNLLCGCLDQDGISTPCSAADLFLTVKRMDRLYRKLPLRGFPSKWEIGHVCTSWRRDFCLMHICDVIVCRLVMFSLFEDSMLTFFPSRGHFVMTCHHKDAIVCCRPMTSTAGGRCPHWVWAGSLCHAATSERPLQSFVKDVIKYSRLCDLLGSNFIPQNMSKKKKEWTSEHKRSIPNKVLLTHTHFHTHRYLLMSEMQHVHIKFVCACVCMCVHACVCVWERLPSWWVSSGHCRGELGALVCVRVCVC